MNWFSVVNVAFQILAISSKARALTISSTTTLVGTETFTEPITIATDAALIVNDVKDLKFEGGFTNDGTVTLIMDETHKSSLVFSKFENHNIVEIQSSGLTPPYIEFGGESWINTGTFNVTSKNSPYQYEVTTNFSSSLKSIRNQGHVSLFQAGYILIPEMANTGTIDLAGYGYALVDSIIEGYGSINVQSTLFLVRSNAELETQNISLENNSGLIMEPSSAYLNVHLKGMNWFGSTENFDTFEYDKVAGELSLKFGGTTRTVKLQTGLNPRDFNNMKGKGYVAYPSVLGLANIAGIEYN